MLSTLKAGMYAGKNIGGGVSNPHMIEEKGFLQSS